MTPGTRFTLPTGLAELADELQHGRAVAQDGLARSWDDRSAAIWATGTPVNDTHVLLKTVQKIDGDLTAMRQDHADKFRAQADIQTKIAEASAAGKDITPDTDLFKALDDAGKAVGALEDKIHAQEVVKARLVEQMGQAGITPSGEGNEDRDNYIAAMRELTGAMAGVNAPRSPGLRIASDERYIEAVKTGRILQSEYDSRIHLGEAMSRDELKAALITGADSGSAGAFVTPQRVGYFPMPMRPLTILDLITIGQTDSDLIEFVRMLSRTNAAAMVPEAVSAATIDGTTVTAVQGGRKPESGMAFEIVQEAVSTLAHWIPATKRALADAGQMRTIIDGMLSWGLGEVLEAQIVNGNGVGDNLLGMLQQTGLNAIAAGPASAADKIHRGKTQIRLDGFNATGIILNPLDAEDIWLSRENTGGPGTGGYLFGSPNNPGPRTLWGLPVAESPAMPQGTALVGALQAAIFWLREGTQIMASDSHADFFTRNLVAVLAEMRGGFGVPTPAAFAEVDLAAA
jgi:HK97 family phage major capsid protein